MCCDAQNVQVAKCGPTARTDPRRGERVRPIDMDSQRSAVQCPLYYKNGYTTMVIDEMMIGEQWSLELVGCSRRSSGASRTAVHRRIMSAEILKRKAQDVIGMEIQTRGGFLDEEGTRCCAVSVSVSSSASASAAISGTS